MRKRGGLRWTLAAAAFAAPLPAAALWNDQLEVFASETAARDDNVFRLSSGRDAQAILGRSSRADTFHTLSLGFKLDVPVERQRFRGGLTFNDTRYRAFKVLNHTSHTGNAEWLWRVGNDLSGEVGYSDSKVLGSLANVQSGVQSGVRNLLEQRRGYANGAYLLSPSWRLSAGAARLEHANNAAERRVNDMELTTGEAGVTYVSRASNEIGLSLREDRGDLANRQTVAAAPGGTVDNDYKQRTIAVVGLWQATPNSRVSGRVGHLKRDYVEVTQRDYSGATYRLTYDWRASGRFNLSAALFREVSLVEEINVGFVLARGVAGRAVWRVAERTELSGTFETSTRDALGEAERTLGPLSPRTDRVHALALGALYRPYRWLTLGAGLRHERRTSNEAFGDYRANVFSLSARAAF